MLQECHLKLYKSCSNSIPRKFLSVWESTFFFFCDGPIKDVHHKKENKIELQESPQRLWIYLGRLSTNLSFFNLPKILKNSML
jgi:hypothetical protein